MTCQEIGVTDDIYNWSGDFFCCGIHGQSANEPVARHAFVMECSMSAGRRCMVATEPDGPVTRGAGPEHLLLNTSGSDGSGPAAVRLHRARSGSHVLVYGLRRRDTRDRPRSGRHRVCALHSDGLWRAVREHVLLRRVDRQRPMPVPLPSPACRIQRTRSESTWSNFVVDRSPRALSPRTPAGSGSGTTSEAVCPR